MRTGNGLFAFLLLSGCALLALILWWLTQSGPQRLQRLLTIAFAEQAEELPPEQLFEQGRWLITHRVDMLQRLSLAWIGAAILGLLEGVDRRRRHPLRGMQYMPFVIGKGGCLCTLGLAVATCFCPWPLQSTLLAAVGSTCLVSTTYWLAAGFPLIH